MKKSENNLTVKIMIYCAVALLVISVGCGIYLVMDSVGAFDAKPAEITGNTEETKFPESTTAETVKHDDVETETNSDGTPKRVVYYKDNVYNGSIDYIYDEKNSAIFEMYYDANDELVECVKTTVNYLGSVVLEEHSLNNEVFLTIKYSYYDDVAVSVKTITEIKDGKELVTKELYSKEGLVTDKYTYEDNVEKSHTVYTYDEEGKLIEEKETE